MPDVTPSQNEKVAYTVVDETAILVCPEDSLMYWLNPVATRIWQLADGRNNVAQIASALCEEFEVDHETALRDIQAMVQTFAEKGLLEIR